LVDEKDFLAFPLQNMQQFASSLRTTVLINTNAGAGDKYGDQRVKTQLSKRVI